MQLAQADAERGALDLERLTKIRDAVSEFTNNISEQDDRPLPKVHSDHRRGSHVGGGDAWRKMRLTKICQLSPKKICLPEWQGEHPVLCVAGHSLIDEAAAIMLGQLSTAHGLAARVEGAEALSTANIFRLETTGVAIVCLIYMDASSPAHMRYSVRRLRRKLPKATIILGCWMKDMDPAALESLREGAKADLAAASLGGALKLCIEATGVEDHSMMPKDQFSTTTAA